MAKTVDTYLEVGSKRVFAGAIEWPGWMRSRRDQEAALQALVDYAPRYAAALGGAARGFTRPKDPSGLRVVERLDGNAGTDFGAPSVAPSADERPAGPAEMRRQVALLKASWAAFERASKAAVGAALKKGPRGGGREQDAIVRHVMEAEASYLHRLGGAYRAEEAGTGAGVRRLRDEILDMLAFRAAGKTPPPGKRTAPLWTPRYFVRRNHLARPGPRLGAGGPLELRLASARSSHPKSFRWSPSSPPRYPRTMREKTISDVLATGKAFVDLSSWRKVAVSGTDASAWLNDLVSADISDLAPGHARRSLLLSPTGGLRAEFTVAVPGGNLVLIQDPSQPSAVDALLSPYVLSSDVQLRDRTHELALFAFPGRGAALDIPGTAVSAPSCAGSGVDLFAPAEDHNFLLGSLAEAYTLAGQEDLDAWRTATGISRFGVDALAGDLPQEAGFEEAVSFDKGCFLGQEAVARVRNLGHPRRVVVHLAPEAEVSAGEDIESDSTKVGEVTSVATVDGHRWLLARVRWEDRERSLRTAAGVPLLPVQIARTDGGRH